MAARWTAPGEGVTSAVGTQRVVAVRQNDITIGVRGQAASRIDDRPRFIVTAHLVCGLQPAHQVSDTVVDDEFEEQPVQVPPGAASDEQLIAMLVDRPRPGQGGTSWTRCGAGLAPDAVLRSFNGVAGMRQKTAAPGRCHLG
ncbi:hypothetical protein [Actinomadura sp. NTSP31]|uniref:hypothetical protein n=1 Tax=Actinomadura sp. NTSP31 TaxID=1735447 RepID=UPI0035C1C894